MDPTMEKSHSHVFGDIHVPFLHFGLHIGLHLVGSLVVGSENLSYPEEHSQENPLSLSKQTSD